MRIYNFKKVSEDTKGEPVIKHANGVPADSIAVEDSLCYFFGLSLDDVQKKLKENHFSYEDKQKAVLYYDFSDLSPAERQKEYYDSLKEFGLI